MNLGSGPRTRRGHRKGAVGIVLLSWSFLAGFSFVLGSAYHASRKDMHSLIYFVGLPLVIGSLILLLFTLIWFATRAAQTKSGSAPAAGHRGHRRRARGMGWPPEE